MRWLGDFFCYFDATVRLVWKGAPGRGSIVWCEHVLGCEWLRIQAESDGLDGFALALEDTW